MRFRIRPGQLSGGLSRGRNQRVIGPVHFCPHRYDMSNNGGKDDGSTEIPIEIEESEERSARQRLEAEAERAVEGFDKGIVDILAWLLETETRARIYVYLRRQPGSTSEEVAEGTGLYPSTVREALAELHEEGTVTRTKRENEGAGNNPYEYEAIPPSDLVGGMLGQVQDQLNTVFNLDDHLRDDEPTSETQPITISVDEPDEDVDEDEEEKR